MAKVIRFVASNSFAWEYGEIGAACTLDELECIRVPMSDEVSGMRDRISHVVTSHPSTKSALNLLR